MAHLDNFQLSCKLESNLILNETSYYYDNKLYIIPKFNEYHHNFIRVYNITNYNDITNFNCNLQVYCNIEIYCNINYFSINTLDKIHILTQDLSSNIIIDKNTCEHNIFQYNIDENINYIEKYNNGFVFNNNIYAIHNSGKYILELSNTTTTFKQKIDITQIIDCNIDNNIIINNNLINQNDLYLIISDENLIIKYDTSLNVYKSLRINDFVNQKKKFSDSLYNVSTNQIFLIPFNISVLTIIDIETFSLKFIDLILNDVELLKFAESKSFFSSGIIYKNYLYLLPYNYDNILLYNINTQLIEFVLLPLNFNNNTKFINSHLFKFNLITYIFVISNNSLHSSIINYSIQNNATLDFDLDFNIITKYQFDTISIDNVYETKNRIEIGNNEFATIQIIRGNTFFEITQNPNNSSLYKFILDSNTNIKYSKKIKSFINYLNNNIYQDDNNVKLFKLNEKQSEIYLSFNDEILKKKLLINNNIDAGSQKIIYSFDNNTLYFIPYNFKFLLALDLDSEIPLLKIIDLHNNDIRTQIFFNTVNSKFIDAILLNNKLYLLPYINQNTSTNYIPFIIYNLNYENTGNRDNNIDIINIAEYNTNTIKKYRLYSKILYYKNNNIEYLLLIKLNSIKSLSVNITNNSIQEIIDNQKNGYLDAVINLDAVTDNSRCFFLNNDGSIFYEYSINLVSSKLNFNTVLKKNIENPNIQELKDLNIQEIYSKILYYNNKLYFIPYNTNYLTIYDITTQTFNNEKILDFDINQELFKSAIFINLNNTTYLILVPYCANVLCMYDINNHNFLYKKNKIFENNKFIGCNIDYKGNIYFNTYDGNMLFYKLNIVKHYRQITLPVQLNNNQHISFKNLYTKFHKNLVYNNYNFNNKQIKFSDYFSKGGSEYYTVSSISQNIFVNDDNINIAKKNSDNVISYTNFINLQKNNKLQIQDFKNAKSQKNNYWNLYDEVSYNINCIELYSNNQLLLYSKSNFKQTTLDNYSYNNSERVLNQISINNIDSKNIDTIYIYVNDNSSNIDIITQSAFQNTYNKPFINVCKNIKYLINTNYQNLFYINFNYYIKDFFQHKPPQYIYHKIPSRTLNNLNKLIINIKNVLEKGIEIDFNKINNFTKFTTIDIIIEKTGKVYNILNNLYFIKITNFETSSKIININIIDKIDKYYFIIDNNNYHYSLLLKLNEIKITKLFIEIRISGEININLDDFKNCNYLYQIIIFTKNNDIIISGGDDILHKIDIIVYDNNYVFEELNITNLIDGHVGTIEFAKNTLYMVSSNYKTLIFEPSGTRQIQYYHNNTTIDLITLTTKYIFDTYSIEKNSVFIYDQTNFMDYAPIIKFAVFDSKTHELIFYIRESRSNHNYEYIIKFSYLDRDNPDFVNNFFNNPDFTNLNYKRTYIGIVRLKTNSDYLPKFLYEPELSNEDLIANEKFNEETIFMDININKLYIFNIRLKTLFIYDIPYDNPRLYLTHSEFINSEPISYYTCNLSDDLVDIYKIAPELIVDNNNIYIYGGTITKTDLLDSVPSYKLYKFNIDSELTLVSNIDLKDSLKFTPDYNNFIAGVKMTVDDNYLYVVKLNLYTNYLIIIDTTTLNIKYQVEISDFFVEKSQINLIYHNKYINNIVLEKIHIENNVLYIVVRNYLNHKIDTSYGTPKTNKFRKLIKIKINDLGIYPNEEQQTNTQTVETQQPVVQPVLQPVPSDSTDY